MRVLPEGLYGITVRAWGFDHLSSAKLLLEAGARIVQFREKELPTREMIAQAKKIKELCESYDAMLIVDDRVDVAYASEADGVHVGQEDFPANLARKVLGDAILGVSASSVSEGVRAQEDGADYVGAGSVFPSSTKPEEKVLGIDGLKELMRTIRIPVYAIGGIKLEHVRTLRDLGVRGVAVISGIFASRDPMDSARRFVEEWKKA